MSLRVTVKTPLDITKGSTLLTACNRHCRFVKFDETNQIINGVVSRADKTSTSFSVSLLTMEIVYDSSQSWVPQRINEIYQVQRVIEESEAMGRIVTESVNEDGEFVLEVEYA